MSLEQYKIQQKAPYARPNRQINSLSYQYSDSFTGIGVKSVRVSIYNTNLSQPNFLAPRGEAQSAKKERQVRCVRFSVSGLYAKAGTTNLSELPPSKGATLLLNVTIPKKPGLRGDWFVVYALVSPSTSSGSKHAKAYSTNLSPSLRL